MPYDTFRIILLCLAFVLFLLAGLQISTPRTSFGWLGLAALTIAVWLK